MGRPGVQTKVTGTGLFPYWAAKVYSGGVCRVVKSVGNDGEGGRKSTGDNRRRICIREHGWGDSGSVGGCVRRSGCDRRQAPGVGGRRWQTPGFFRSRRTADWTDSATARPLCPRLPASPAPACPRRLLHGRCASSRSPSPAISRSHFPVHAPGSPPDPRIIRPRLYHAHIDRRLG